MLSFKREARLSVLGIAMALCQATLVWGEADTGKAFTYQGRLMSGGSPANGIYDLQFTMIDAETGPGLQFVVAKDDVTVSQGLFAVELDFGNNFMGRAFYLEIAVRPGDSGGDYTILTPRQKITAAPYAAGLAPGAEIQAARTGSSNVHIANLATSGNSTGLAVESASPEGTALSAENYNGVGGDAIRAKTNSDTAYAVVGLQTGYAKADQDIWLASGGLFGGLVGALGMTKEPMGVGVAGWHKSATGAGAGIAGETTSPDGWTGWFSSLVGNGVAITTPGDKVGLSVVGGTKNAVVATSEGSRLLYTEESAEVWFTDYGSGQLQGGVAMVAIDPTFAQTVNLAETYHVFVQPCGKASLYIARRTTTSFEVALDEGDPNVEFSYRLVAKRFGHEERRLERAPWADNDANLHPERAGRGAFPGAR